MRLTRTAALVAPLLVLAATGTSAQPSIRKVRELYQGRRGPEQTDTLSRKIKVGRDGRVSISNVSGAITVTAAAGDEMSIDAVKRGYRDRSELDRVRIVVDDRPGRVDIRTEYPSTFWRNDNVSVDYTVVVPAGVSLDVNSVSGRIRIDGVKGGIRLGSVSGNITSSNTPRVESLRTVSGEVDLANISQDGTLSMSSVSGNITVNGVRARAVEVNTVSGEIRLREAVCERVSSRGVSGGFEYAGTLARNGRYEVNSHSGNVRFVLAENTGFELNASSFSGSVRSEYAMTVGGDRNPEIQRGRGPRRDSLQSRFGDGSASLDLHTFSGNITIAKK